MGMKNGNKVWESNNGNQIWESKPGPGYRTNTLYLGSKPWIINGNQILESNMGIKYGNQIMGIKYGNDGRWLLFDIVVPISIAHHFVFMYISFIIETAE